PHRRGQEPRHGRGRDVLRPARRGAEARARVEAAVVVSAPPWVTRGLDPQVHRKNASLKRMDCRGLSAFTRVFDALCPAMTESAENLLVPQGGFEPSTYRLRSDCSAVELLRRPERAFYQTSIKQAAPS